MAMSVLRGRVPGDLSGYGDGYGYGHGDGYDIVSCKPSPVLVTAEHLAAANACADQLLKFKRAFPGGGNWPADAEKARALGLDLEWARQKLGLLLPAGDGGRTT